MDVTLALGCWQHPDPLLAWQAKPRGCSLGWSSGGAARGAAVPTGPTTPILPRPGVTVALGSLLVLLVRLWVRVPSTGQ